MRTKYIFKNKKYSYSELQGYLYEYCLNNRNPTHFNLSRSFDFNDERGEWYNLRFIFDRDENLQKVFFSKIGRTFKGEHFKYYLDNTDCLGGFFRTKDEMLKYVKDNPNKFFTLSVCEFGGKPSIFGIKYKKESNTLEVGQWGSGKIKSFTLNP